MLIAIRSFSSKIALITLATACVIAVVIAPSASAAQKPPRTCWPKGSKVWRTSETMRIFRAGRDYTDPERGKQVTFTAPVYFACHLETRRWTAVFDDTSGDALGGGLPPRAQVARAD